MLTLKSGLFALLFVAGMQAWAGGSNSGITPGARMVSGSISEWQVPTAKYARDPAVAPDGRVYFAVRAGDKIARFDPATRRFQEWDVPTGMEPRGLLVARDGTVFFGGSNNGTLGEFDPASGKMKFHKLPSGDADPYTLVFDAEDNIWFTERKVGKLGRLERATGKITEYPIGDKPYALSVDKPGMIWVTRKDADRVTRFDPKTGQITELAMTQGSQPRRTAIAPDGMLWVSLYGIGKLAKIDTKLNRLVKEYDLPGGPNGGPYAVNADANGRIWVGEVQSNEVVMLDSNSGSMRVFKFPTRDSGVRKAAIDANGRYWYVGSHAGKLGVIE